MAKYISNRQQNLKIGIVSYTEDKTVLEVTGKVGIGTTNATSKLDVVGDVRISSNVTAQNYYGSGAYLTGISTFANTNILSGIFTDLYVSGISTLGITSATNLTAQQLNVSGVSTLGTVKISSGIITSSNPGVSTVVYYGDGSNLQGVNAFNVINQDIISSLVFPTFASNTGVSSVGISTTKLVFVPASGNLGIGTTNATSKLTVQGDVNVSGVVTATTFIGALTGIAASATQLVTPRTFQITGDVVASPISFDGTGNVSLAATIQPNSVGLGTDTTGDYVRDITGTANQITVTGGTGEGSTPTLSIPSQFTAPQDVTVTRDLLVNRNLNVNGNITIGGTSATLFTTELKISDPDIVLGFRTDGSGNDVSNDNTANHGGVALASTEGTPLVQLFIAGIETNPATYKKIMWFKSGTFAGLGTDAWLINYAVGIGSTQFPTGTRLAAGNVQFTQNDLAVVRNINSSGIVTATTFIGALTGTASSTTNIPNLTGAITSNNTTTSLGSFSSSDLATALTDETGSGANVFATSPTLVNPVLGAASATSIVVSGIATINQLDVNQLSPDGSNYGTSLYVPVANGSGGWNWATVASAGAGNLNGIDIREEGTIVGTAGSTTSIDFRGNNIIATGTAGGAIATVRVSDTPTFDSLVVSSGSTFTNGPILVGTSVSTGTTSQPLQVSGGAYVSGSVGIGTTNPTKPLHIYTADGDIRIGDITDGTGSTDAGIIFTGLGTVTSALFTEVNGTILSYAINTEQIIGIQTARAGGIFRLDTRNPGSFGDANCFVVKARPIGTTTEYSALVVGLNDGSTYLSPVRGNVLVGTSVSTGTTSQPLQVTGGAYVSGNLGIGTTNPTSKLTVVGNANITGVLTASNGIQGIGIQSGGVNITTGIITTLNFVGTAVSTITNSSGLVEINVKAGQFTRGTSTFTATAGQTSFSVNYTPNFIDVFLNGVKLTSSEFTATNGTSVVLTDAAFVDDIIDVVVFQNSGLFDSSKWSAETPLTPSSGNIYRVSGNVGIGTTNPTSKLHVIGDARITGVVTATTFVGALTGTATSTTNIPNLTGAITSVNTTTSLGSFTSAQLATALTDETGSGANVFATSPTLVTPSLGIATATSIVVAGIVTANSSGIDLNGTVLNKSELKNYTETVYAQGNTGITTTLNLVNGNVFTATLNGNCTFTFTTGVTSGAASFTLILTNDATAGRSITWPVSVKWPNNTIPVRTTTANATDIWSFFTPNNGTTWYGNVALYNFT